MKIQLTEEDVLRGSCIISVEQRDGNPVQVHCKALSWAAALKVGASDPGDSVVLTVLSGVQKQQANDEFLNELTPESLMVIANTVMQLTHGLPALKKAQAARINAQPSSPITMPPPASCANLDSAVASAMDSARHS
jgi:hypothetical protein